MIHITSILFQSWQIMLDSAVFILFGFFIAAIIRAFLSAEMIGKYLGGNNLKGVFLAALFGVPLPLCSCGVVPTAMALRKQGASRASTLSFLITTPESSVDSIAITYAMFDPLMTVARPVAAFITGIVAGVGEILFGKKDEIVNEAHESCADCHDCCGGEGHRHSLGEKLKNGFRFAFVELLSDIAGWFILGVLIAGAISYGVPDTIIEKYLGSNFYSMLIMLAVGLPLYVCATASTPIAAALVLKGMSPGAALVFLMAGPATNAASFTVLVKMLGVRSSVIYLISISLTAVALGSLLNWIYSFSGIDPRAIAGHAHEMIPGWIKYAAAILMSAIMLWHLVRKMRARM